MPRNKRRKPSRQQRKKQQLKHAEAMADKRHRMAAFPYHEYLKTTHWIQKRRQALNHHGQFCCVCRSTNNIQVHHKSYSNLWDEAMDDLEVRCEGCHANAHEEEKPLCYDPMTAKYLELCRSF